MKLTRPSDVKALLQELEFQPSKLLGQNFLIDGNILRILVDAAGIQPGDFVLEVGPGLGVLTEELLARGARLVAVEKDKRLYAYLSRTLSSPLAELRHADILDVDLDALLAAGIHKCVANLPYSIGSRFLVNLFEARQAVDTLVITVQKEVACRLAARPGSPDYGLLSVLAQLRYHVSVVKSISPTCFFPPPEVTSSIVQLKARTPIPTQEEMIRTRRLLKRCFSARRKQLFTTLRSSFKSDAESTGNLEKLLQSTGIGSKTRPEEIPPLKWMELGVGLAGMDGGLADEKGAKDSS